MSAAAEAGTGVRAVVEVLARALTDRARRRARDRVAAQGDDARRAVRGAGRARHGASASRAGRRRRCGRWPRPPARRKARRSRWRFATRRTRDDAMQMQIAGWRRWNLSIWDEMALVGRIARAHGIRGQVIVNPETDFPEERFQPGAELFVERGGVDRAADADDRPVSAGPAGDRDRGRRDDERRRGAGRAASCGCRSSGWRRCRPGTFYRHDLVGCRVETRDGRAGRDRSTRRRGHAGRQPAGGRRRRAARC